MLAAHIDILLLRRQELRLWAMGQTDSLTTPAAVLLSNPEPKTAVAAVDYRLLYDEPKVEHRPESASEAEENPHLSRCTCTVVGGAFLLVRPEGYCRKRGGSGSGTALGGSFPWSGPDPDKVG